MPHRSARIATSAASQARGLHLIGDLHGCQNGGALMHDAQALQTFCHQQVIDAGLTPVGQLFHGFEQGGGVTGVVVLAESHLSVHTWPETGYVTLDVYVCNYSADNRAKAQSLFDGIVAAFDPQQQAVHRIERG